jgi:hypothetical protein
LLLTYDTVSEECVIHIWLDIFVKGQQVYSCSFLKGSPPPRLNRNCISCLMIVIDRVKMADLMTNGFNLVTFSQLFDSA